MKNTVYFPEIFAMVGEAETRKDKIAVLHKFQHEKGFMNILELCYDPRCEWVVTREEIEHLTYDDMDIADYDLAPSTLFLEARRRLYNFTNVRQPPLKKYKVLQLIAGMFSVLYHEEVELFKQMVDGRILEKGLTENLVREAFPGFLSERDIKEPPVNVSNKLTEGSMLSNTKVVESTKKPVGSPPVPKPKKKGKPQKSKLDSHKEEIYSLLKENKSKSSIAKQFSISISGFNNWLKKNPMDGK